MQVCGGAQSFNAVNRLRILGRWMRLLTILNQSPTPIAFLKFDDGGRMKPSAYYDRIVDVYGRAHEVHSSDPRPNALFGGPI